MPIRVINGIDLSYDEYGAGEPVLMITGTGMPGRAWRAYQVPALTKAGFRVITVDNRGIPPSDPGEPGFTLTDMVADTVGLIEELGIGPCRIVGFSMGAIIVQETLVARPDLIEQAILIATRGRTDPLRAASGAAELELLDSGVKLPPRFEAVIRVMQGFSRKTLNNEQVSRDWVDIFEMSPVSQSTNRSQLAVDMIPNRLAAYGSIRTPCMVLAFEDDLIAPPHLCREVADSIPGCGYQVIKDCGHFGYLEQPAEVNASIVDFFGAS